MIRVGGLRIPWVVNECGQHRLEVGDEFTCTVNHIVRDGTWSDPSPANHWEANIYPFIMSEWRKFKTWHEARAFCERKVALKMARIRRFMDTVEVIK